jgi:hypothetical protein
VVSTTLPKQGSYCDILLDNVIVGKQRVSTGVGLQAGFKVVKLNEDDNTPPPQYLYAQQSQTYVQTENSVLSQQSMSHKASASKLSNHPWTNKGQNLRDE